jgi:hypothetical protein
MRVHLQVIQRPRSRAEALIDHGGCPVNAPIRLSFVLLAVTLSACATTGGEASSGARLYREPTLAADPVPRAPEPIQATTHGRETMHSGDLHVPERVAR